MFKFLSIYFLCFASSFLFARCSEVPAELRAQYAADMNYAFNLQCQGKSTLASCQFKTAYEEAKKCGESIIKLNAIEQLFIWYRMYGSSLKLFEKTPTGTDRIVGEYRTSYLKQSSPFQSQWGKTPEQAAQIRDFMLGVGEIISGIFCVTIATPLGVVVGPILLQDGASRMFNSLNNLWAGHQALISLKQWEQGPLKTAQND